MSHPIVFLDVDGVLNSEAFLRKIDARHRELGHAEPTRPKSATTCTCYQLKHQIDRDAIERLNRLVAETHAKIVISSSWRKLLDPPELHRVLALHGLVAEIIGETPDGNDPEMLASFGYLDRIFRGNEIDLWLRRHPEVERFVILGDGGDMAMHKNRLVQTDCEDGLLDDHVDLAIRVLAWDGKTIPSPFDEMEVEGLEIQQPPTNYRVVVEDGSIGFRAITSTRSNTNDDAHRDFDGFNVDEELRRLRAALRDGQWHVAAELTANLDESLCRGGSLPVAWLGPTCMQDEGDCAARLQSSMEAAAVMTKEEQQEAVDGYVGRLSLYTTATVDQPPRDEVAVLKSNPSIAGDVQDLLAAWDRAYSPHLTKTTDEVLRAFERLRGHLITMERTCNHCGHVDRHTIATETDTCGSCGVEANPIQTIVAAAEPEPSRNKDKPPGSSWGIYCNHDQHKREGRCLETLTLARTTTVAPSHEDDYQNLGAACYEAAVFLGWRTYRSVFWCPTHVVAKKLVCKRCAMPCPSCSCLDGPRIDAVDGDPGE